MTNDDWLERFLSALDEKSERRDAYDRLLEAGVNAELLQAMLREMFAADFVERKHAKMRAAIVEGQRLLAAGCQSASARQVNKVEQAFRAALGPKAAILIDCPSPWSGPLAPWLENAIRTYQKHSSKKMLGSLNSRNCRLMLLTTIVEMQTGSPHYGDVAHVMEAAAKVSGTTNIPREINEHWVAVTVKRFNKKFSNYCVRVIRPLAAKYLRSIRHQETTRSSQQSRGPIVPVEMTDH